MYNIIIQKGQAGLSVKPRSLYKLHFISVLPPMDYWNLAMEFAYYNFSRYFSNPIYIFVDVEPSFITIMLPRKIR